ncbi:MAG TPA: methyltransferase domain-containing protein [Candidatus Dormibacteraeota bacterium]|nr:methyltransferase domain-containing protein [Candidatus Dormibacteraeota bacterium]
MTAAAAGPGDPTRAAHLYALLRCPRCGTAPSPEDERCSGCGRTVATSGGGLDLLDPELAGAAGRFAEHYPGLRAKEGWVDAGGREDPETGDPRLWRRRLAAAAAAAAILDRELPHEPTPVVGDVGSGGGWAARLLPRADVIAFDLLDVPPGAAALRVRADMRRLPVRDAAVDALLYVAALHHAPVAEAVAEAARVLRPGGLLVAVDSPVYADAAAAGQATRRSAAYYARMGSPDLAASYHPIDAGALRGALSASRLQVERLDAPRGRYGRLSRLLGRRAFPMVVARAG